MLKKSILGLQEKRYFSLRTNMMVLIFLPCVYSSTWGNYYPLIKSIKGETQL